MKTRLALFSLLAAMLLAANGSAAQQKSKDKPKEPAPAPAAQPAADVDLAYGAYQRGYYIYAFNEAKRRAEQEQDPKAMTLLGELYAGGWGVKQDDEIAFSWYRQAAEKGDREAIAALGLFYLQGRGVIPNREEAAEQFKLAAEKGNATAAYNLALLYLEGQVFQKDFAAAAKWFRVAAEQDLPDAQQALATLYREGEGVPKKDPAEAARWLARASALRHAPSMTEYAFAVYNGWGVPKDEQAGGRWFKLAALYGNPIAQNRLAYLLANGMGGFPKDMVKAMAWHLYARARGDSSPELDAVFAKLPESERDTAQKILQAWETGGPLPRT
jgi:TPR repeat protein